jgi:predicted dehydrogenase
MSTPIRVGIVGANAHRGWARDAHVPALKSLPQFEITAISARNQALVDEARPVFGAARSFGDSLEMVRDPAIDLVAVTVKVPEHRAIVLAALEAGKHVYCEWPLGVDLAESREMAARVPPSHHVMIGLQGVFSPAIVQAAKLIRTGAIGRPLILRGFTTAAAWGAEIPLHNAYLQEKSTGATLETIGGGHALAAIEALIGGYTEVDARNTTLRKTIRIACTNETMVRNCADHMLVLGAHETGCISSLEVLGGTSSNPSLFEITGETGWIKIMGTVPGTCQIPRLQLEASVAFEPLPEHITPGLQGPPVNVALAYARFAEDIAQGTTTVPDFETALALTSLLHKIDTASATGLRQHL